MLNEMFTGTVPHGTEYGSIEQVSQEHGYLDAIVSSMLRQNSAHRPNSVADVKKLIQKHQFQAVSLQKISAIDNTVVSVSAVDDPLALEPPRLVDFEWEAGDLTLILDRTVTQQWVGALQRMGSFICHGKRARGVSLSWQSSIHQG